jgi:AraC-like DNA-binding protein
MMYVSVRIWNSKTISICRLSSSICFGLWPGTVNAELSTAVDPRALLAAHPIAVASDRDGLAAELKRAYPLRRVESAGGDVPFQAIVNRVQLLSVTLHYCRFDTPTRVDFGPMPGFRQLFCLSGSGEIRVDGCRARIDADATGIISPGSPSEASFGDFYQHLVVQIAEDEARRKAEMLLGQPINPDFDGPTVVPVAGSGLQRLKAVALALACQFSHADAGNDLVILALEQALISAFLFENRSAFSTVAAHQPRLAGRGDIARLEDYIHAHWDRPLLIEDVAVACGVSVRSVFLRFKQARSVSPHTYLRNVRLDNARRLLLDRQCQLSVIDVGFRCGFASLGHFARRYRERFGELPSTTLSRRSWTTPA